MSADRMTLFSFLVMVAMATGACDDEPVEETDAPTGGMGGTAGTGGSAATGGTGGSSGAEWACIGTLDAPSYGANVDVDVNANVHDSADMPLANVTVRVCAYADAACATPVFEATTTSTGQAIVETPLDSRHYVEHSAAGYVDTLAMTNGPPVANPCEDPDETACTCDGCSQVQCDDGDNNFTDCTCPQCADDPYCSNTDNCNDDGECNPWLEGCVCDDCLDHPACGGVAGPGFVCDVSKAANQDALMHTQAEIDSFFSLNGGSEDPARGHVGFGIADCDAMLAPGVVVSASTADAETIVAYDDAAGIPTTSLDESSTAGIALFLNLPPGEVTITGTVAATGEVVATRTAFVRAGTVTIAAPMSPVPQAP